MATKSMLFWMLLFFTSIVGGEKEISNELSQDQRREKREAVLPYKQPPLRYSPPPAYPEEGSSSNSSVLKAILKFESQVYPITYSTSTRTPSEGKGIGKGKEKVEGKGKEEVKGKENDDKDEPCLEEEDCVPLVYCAAFYEEVLDDNSFCNIGDVLGAICRAPLDIENQPFAPPALTIEEDTEVIEIPLSDIVEKNVSRVSAITAENEVEISLQVLQTQNSNLEQEVRNQGFIVDDPKTPEFGHLQFFRTSEEALEIANIALAQDIAVNTLLQSSIPDSDDGPPRGSPGESIPPSCPAIPVCDDFDVYRRYDGSCNNLNNPTWGKSFTPFRRLSGAQYDDGINVPRKAMSGKDLPSARKVSAVIAPDVDKPSPTYTLSVMQWGQFIDHDLTQSPIARYDPSTGIQCCDLEGGPLPSMVTHPQCFAIEIPEDDPFYSEFGRRCMNFVRSLPAPDVGCPLGPRNQMNQLSHFLDGSEIYGSSIEQANSLRVFVNGLLKLQGNQFLPDDPTTPVFDFLAGDNRVNEQPHLIIIHTIWVRQHNLIAAELRNLQPNWDDEKLYQEARKIVVAQTQHIVYNEWLPVVLGTDTVNNFGLLPKRTGFISSYDETLNPSIFNEFASVAFRFGHTLLQGTLQLFNNLHNPISSVELSNTFLKPQILTGFGVLAQLLRGLVRQPMQQFDNCVVDDVTNKLFQTEFSLFGLDLVALNTQRGRDHGVGSYNNILQACGFKKLARFDQLAANMKPSVASLFDPLYENVRDIDPFVAGISENPVSGGILGRLFSCIVRKQFMRLKFGDRFFYENGGLQHSFTEAQLNEIRKTSWARIICDNVNTIQTIQPLAFRIPDSFNARVQCSSKAIPKLDISPWL